MLTIAGTSTRQQSHTPKFLRALRPAFQHISTGYFMLSLSRCIHSFSIAVLYVATATTAAEPERSIQFNFPDQNFAQELLAQKDLYTATASPFDR
ncbi:hypothetical protein N9B38_03260, partial [bacterium]|nr:hypothetical protein [bacterium]